MRIIIIALLIMVWGPVAGQTSEIFQKDGKAIGGYDPVAFFTQGAAVKGNEAIRAEWKGAQWYFGNEEHKNAFLAEPAKYAPQYGGYCAYGTADGHKAPTMADTWTIIDGKLYFNYNKKVKELWNKDTKGYIGQADKNWPLIMHQ